MPINANLKDFLDQALLALKNLFLPAFCRRCDARILTEENLYYCPACWSEIRLIERPFCSICGKPHDKAAGFAERDNFPCAECSQIKRRPYGRMFAATAYDGVAQEAILLFKYGSRQLLAVPLGKLMMQYAEREVDFDQYDMVVPVPLHRVRRRERGFNQSEELARYVCSRITRLTLQKGLVRIRATQRQTRLNSAERRRNVKGAFAVVQDGAFENKKVLLVDDVITTGATSEECARMLRRAGAELVDVLAIARPLKVLDN